jgi:DNA-binding NtrC family response regulator
MVEVPITTLIVDDNLDLLHFLGRLLKGYTGSNVLMAASCDEARKLAMEGKPTVSLIDYVLPDGNGVELGVELHNNEGGLRVIVMTGTIFPPEEEALCEEHGFPILRKPFLASDVVDVMRNELETHRLVPLTDTSTLASQEIITNSGFHASIQPPAPRSVTTGVALHCKYRPRQIAASELSRMKMSG